ncbi:MAG: methyltransferase domain-containing protein [Deltaproteobacteria bacterium]|nr:methyltransferase domain-containing protein [Deltaproteobacteria bacterium]
MTGFKQPLSGEAIHRLYAKRARFYDFTVNLYYLLGFRKFHYRRRAVEALGLQMGDTVVEIACGTGLNFGLLCKAVGPRGRVVGVDFSPQMLDVARRRVARRNWPNVVLVQCDAADYRFPPRVNGVLSTFALTLIPHYEKVVAVGCQALAAGGRFVVLDLQIPRNWLRPLAPLGLWLVRPFGNTWASTTARPWEALARHLPVVRRTSLYFDVPYLAVGHKERR